MSDDRLERSLRELTSWEGERPQPALWEKAAAAAASDPPSRRRVLHRRRWRIAGRFAAVAATLALLVSVAMLTSTLAPVRQSSITVPERTFTAGQLPSESARYGYSTRESYRAEGLADGRLGQERFGFQSPGASPAPEEGHLGAVEGARVTLRTNVSNALIRPEQPDASPPPAADRHVVRKASIEFKSTDVRAAFLKASLIPNAALGEYVEDSSVTGEGATVAANLTLRVTADRLPDVLNQVRELGTVTSEQVRGEDVTAQVVDIDSRLRNERRIEQELLELLENRQDAPLKDILELRTKLSEVRGEIERMEGQRATLGRLVSLATVLVLIRPAGAPPPAPEKSSILSHLDDSFSAAWRTGVEFLIDSGAAIVRIGLGGLIWWAIAIAAIVLLRRQLRRAALLRGDV